MATAAGVVLGLAPLPFFLAAAVWGTVLWVTGYVSVASMTAAIGFPLFARLFDPDNPVALLAGLAIAAFIIFTHRANIRRLLEGRESRFGHRKRTA